MRTLCRAAFLLAALSSLSAAQPAAIPATPPSPADSSIKITLLTMGQGDQLWEFFGHNALWVRDPVTGIDSVYNWGVFDLHAEGFLPRFLRGEMLYTMDAATIQLTLAFYRYYNRRIWAQDLDLTPSEKREIADYIRWNSRPENRQYRYNYYLDNCSTRVRDIIDRALHGQLRAYLRGIETHRTYRDYSLTHMERAPVIMTGMNVGLGRSADVPLTADEASFLPAELMGYLKDFTVDGGKRRLVSREYVVSEAERAPEPTTAPVLWKPYLAIGLGVAALILALAFGLRSRHATATVVAIVAGVFGLVGLVILFLVGFTDHVAAHRNENMWMLNPIWLVVAVALPMLLVRRRGKVGRWFTLAGGALALCAVLMHVAGLSRQPNWDVIGLLLPSQLAMAALVIARRRAP
jgi:hypothetical protein